MIDVDPDFAESFVLPLPGLFVDPVDVPVAPGAVDVPVDVLPPTLGAKLEVPLASMVCVVLTAEAVAELETAALAEEVAVPAAAPLYKVARAVEATSVPSSTHSPDPTSSDLSGKMPICPDEQQK